MSGDEPDRRVRALEAAGIVGGAVTTPSCSCYPGQPEFHDCHPDVECQVHGSCAFEGHPLIEGDCYCGAIRNDEEGMV